MAAKQPSGTEVATVKEECPGLVLEHVDYHGHSLLVAALPVGGAHLCQSHDSSVPLKLGTTLATLDLTHASVASHGVLYGQIRNVTGAIGA